MAILECRGLCKSYGAEPALDRVDLAVEPGHIVGLLAQRRAVPAAVCEQEPER